MTILSSLSGHIRNTDAASAPCTVEALAASVLGALIAARVLDLRSEAGETIVFVDGLICEAIDSALDKIDTVELGRALAARYESRKVAANDHS